MTDIYTAAQSLIVKLNAPAQAHSVWIRAEVIKDDDGKQYATGKRELCVSIRPNWKKRIKVPEVQDGIPVVNVPWPRGS